MRKNTEELELNQIQTTLQLFLKSYNQNIPIGFPRASVAILKKFQNIHPMLFKQNSMWSIARHQKRLIDWLSSRSDVL